MIRQLRTFAGARPSSHAPSGRRTPSCGAPQWPSAPHFSITTDLHSEDSAVCSAFCGELHCFTLTGAAAGSQILALGCATHVTQGAYATRHQRHDERPLVCLGRLLGSQVAAPLDHLHRKALPCQKHRRHDACRAGAHDKRLAPAAWRRRHWPCPAVKGKNCNIISAFLE
jgi:hypothetical protein